MPFVFVFSYRKRSCRKRSWFADHRVSRIEERVYQVFRAIQKFLLRDELGQDLAEYCLVTALLAVVALGIIFHVSGGVDGIAGMMHKSVASGGPHSGPARAPVN
jgi:Flp pilus assembly pilin Flp